MNRPIKFRAWDCVNKKMYVSELEAVAFAKNGNPANASISGFSRPLIAIGDEPQITLTQFTGLHDKNGKEIYEGDILNNSSNGKGFVEWDERQVTYRINAKQSNMTLSVIALNSEIIGNIYENPELIQKL